MAENTIETFFETYDPTDSLAHHGIKGQKWGIRRWQNLDGTLTDEGKKRYAKAKERWSDESIVKRENRAIASVLGGGALYTGGLIGGVIAANPILAGAGAAAGIAAMLAYPLKDAIMTSRDNRMATLAKDEALKKKMEDIRSDQTGTRAWEVRRKVRWEKQLEKQRRLNNYEKEVAHDDKKSSSFDIKKEMDAAKDNLKIVKKAVKGKATEEDAKKITKQFNEQTKDKAEKEIEKLKKLKAQATTKEEKEAYDDWIRTMNAYKNAPKYFEQNMSELFASLKHSDLDDFFAHSGIKGQKWGLRRFQYTDGSLTPEGRKRYLKGGDRAVRKAEKIQSKREKILSDRKKLYKHRNEFSKEEIDKAMERFASQDRLREQMQSIKDAKRQDKADYKRSKIEYKKLKLQEKQMKEQEKQAKLATEQKKIDTEQKNEVAEAQSKAAKWRERANKARSIYDFAKAGQDILSDMGITSKEGNESLLGALGEAMGIKDNSAAKAAAARKKAIAKETEDLNLEKLRTAVEQAKYNLNNPNKKGMSKDDIESVVEDVLKNLGITP